MLICNRQKKSTFHSTDHSGLGLQQWNRVSIWVARWAVTQDISHIMTVLLDCVCHSSHSHLIHQKFWGVTVLPLKAEKQQQILPECAIHLSPADSVRDRQPYVCEQMHCPALVGGSGRHTPAFIPHVSWLQLVGLNSHAVFFLFFIWVSSLFLFQNATLVVCWVSFTPWRHMTWVIAKPTLSDFQCISVCLSPQWKKKKVTAVWGVESLSQTFTPNSFYTW